MISERNQTLTTCGIDVGSSSIKIAIVRCGHDSKESVVAMQEERILKRNPLDVVTSLFAALTEKVELSRERLDYIATTGEGDGVSIRTGHFYGMTTHARGGLYLEPKARAVLDIGALHGRAVLMDEKAKVLSYRMTSQCASGSGQFLVNISRYLGVTLDEIGPFSLTAEAPEVCSSICAVLAETDVINMVSRGISIPNILKGIHLSMATRYVRLLHAAGASGTVLVTGGLARDVGLLAALQEAAAEHGGKVGFITNEGSAYAGALGAALWGAFRIRKLAKKGLSLGAMGSR